MQRSQKVLAHLETNELKRVMDTAVGDFRKIGLAHRGRDGGQCGSIARVMDWGSNTCRSGGGERIDVSGVPIHFAQKAVMHYVSHAESDGAMVAEIAQSTCVEPAHH